MDKDLLEQTVLQENEIEANKIMGLALILLFGGGILCSVLVFAEFFDEPRFSWVPFMILNEALLLVGYILNKIYKGHKKWLKVMMLTIITLTCAGFDAMFTASVAILICIPVILSIRYFTKRLTIYVFIVSLLIFMISAIFGANYGLLDLNSMELPLGTELRFEDTTWIGSVVSTVPYDRDLMIIDTLLYSYLPKALVFTVVALVCIGISGQGRKLVLKQQKLSTKSARISAELSLAERIQRDMLPSIFPAFPEIKEIDLYASMTPAKEVGGDFYDYFQIDDDHIGFMIADVSGKGIPAAMFMMFCKHIIANNALLGKNPAKALEDANAAICANNSEDMFVTVWLGILEISTGHFTAANAGHEYPAIKSPDGGFELYKDKHGFVIGGMEGVKYKEYELDLQPGAKIFVYTDGVPEASNPEENMFGTDNMIKALNVDADASPETILKNVRGAVDDFSKGAEQFDDLTMLCIEYKG